MQKNSHPLLTPETLKAAKRHKATSEEKQANKKIIARWNALSFEEKQKIVDELYGEGAFPKRRLLLIEIKVAFELLDMIDEGKIEKRYTAEGIAEYRVIAPKE
jgi:hypothetical protein